MIDKAMSVKRDKLGPPFGRLDDETMLSVARSLAAYLVLPDMRFLRACAVRAFLAKEPSGSRS
jgi:hypothetical protein